MAADLPSDISLELGEFLYQLRSALDATIYAAAIIESRKDPPPGEHLIEFPLCSTPEQFADATYKIAPLSGERRAIVESMQPYNSPPWVQGDLLPYNFNRCFGILNDWARKDRHRRLHVVGGWASDIDPMLALPPGVTPTFIEIPGRPLFLERGEVQVSAFQLDGWDPSMTMEANPNLTIDPAVADAPLPIHESDTLARRLECMLRGVSEVVDRFEASFGTGSDLA